MGEKQRGRGGHQKYVKMRIEPKEILVPCLLIHIVAVAAVKNGEKSFPKLLETKDGEKDFPYLTYLTQ